MVGLRNNLYGSSHFQLLLLALLLALVLLLVLGDACRARLASMMPARATLESGE